MLKRTCALVSISLVVFIALASAGASSAAQSTSAPVSGKPHPGTAAAQARSTTAQASAPTQAGAPMQSGVFTVSQLGHAVGTADFHLARTASGYDSSSTVHVSMKGLEYALSKTEQLDPSSRIQHEQLSATVNDSAVNVTGKPDAAQFLLNISSNGRSSTTRLAAHNAAVFLPDFDPGGLETLLTVAAGQNGRDLWAILPKRAGSVVPVQLATYADERGTLNGKPISVHHLIATIAGASTDLFAGADDQLLQAELPQQGFSLVRKGFVLTPPKRPIAPIEPDSSSQPQKQP
ncbi:MAG TPA: hypothetical protein VGG85_13105 [Terracidiphilus sp.]